MAREEPYVQDHDVPTDSIAIEEGRGHRDQEGIERVVRKY